MRRRPTRPQLRWALYDWANSAFATTVMAGFFPLFFKQYWSAGTEATTSTFWLGFGNSLASLLIVLLAPLLGALADTAGTHRRNLGAFALLGVLATAGLFLVGEGNWPVAIAVYVIAILGFSGANVFYDSMLPALAAPGERHRVSALGYSLGYLGGGVLFLVNVVMTLQPGLFGLADAGVAVRVSFLTVSIWWLAFSLPLLLGTPTAPAGTGGAVGSVGAGAAPVALPASAAGEPLGTRVALALRQLLATLREVRGQRNLWLFLLAYWLYIDGVATIIRMAVDYGIAIGLPANSLIVALLLVQFIGFPATLVFGRLGERHGAKPALTAAISVYVVATVAAVFMTTALHFYLLACTLGLVQGGVQSLSRSMFSRLIPEARAGEYFGFLNMLGKAAAVVGPVLVGTVAAASGSPRIGILSVIALFVGGLVLLARVEEPREADGNDASGDSPGVHGAAPRA